MTKPSGDRSTKKNSRSDRGAKTERPLSAAEARAEFEANREANKAARQRELAAAFPDGLPGRWIYNLSWVTTAVFALVSVLAVISLDRFIAAYFAVSVVLFFAGCAVFAIDIVLMASRSRDDLMGIGGLFLLAGSAPKPVQVSLLSALAVQILVAIVGASIHPFTALAFGTLVPILGLSLCGLWSVLHGHFPPQIADDSK
ncbi:MAG TPA: hypothetical protein VL068_14275 [Microthrixaceae bacterium]|nr:hypothetical protein [Microthrixaceae bacterium]